MSAVPVIDWPSQAQPSATAISGLSKPSDDTATGASRAMPRNHSA